MDLKLRGSVVMIVGATAGIGAATARLLVAEGARLALVARREAELNRVCRELVAAGYASREELMTRDKDVRARIAAAADYAIASPMPNPATVSNHVFASARSDR